MDTMETKKIFWLRILTCAVVAILVLLIGLSIMVFRTLHSVHTFERRIDVVLTRVETVSEQLEELDIEAMVSTVNDVTRQLEASEITESIQSLTEITADLKDIDWRAIADHADSAVVQAEKSMAAAERALDTVQETMDAMDLTGLVKAIQDLKTAVEPLTALGSLLKR